MTCQYFSQNCNIFSVLSIFKYSTGKANSKFITSIISQRHTETSPRRKRRIIVYGFGHSLWSAVGCQRKFKNQGDLAGHSLTESPSPETRILPGSSLRIPMGLAKRAYRVDACVRGRWSNKSRSYKARLAQSVARATSLTLLTRSVLQSHSLSCISTEFSVSTFRV